MGQSKGLVFVKFASEADRDTAIGVIRAGRHRHGGNVVWARADQAVEVRVPESFLFGFKKLLVDWGFGRAEVRVEIETASLKVGGALAVSAEVRAGELCLRWHGLWTQWTELHEDPEFKVLTAKFQKMLSDAAGGRGKGKGKAGQ